MFDKNLTDLVRGIRNNKENEVGFEVMNKITFDKNTFDFRPNI